MNELASIFDRLMTDRCPPATVRNIEAGGNADALWAEFEALGFADALVAEDRGGSGLGLADVRDLVFLTGVHACPLPLADTMVARAILAAGDCAAPPGLIVLLRPAPVADGYLCRGAALAGLAGHALIEIGDDWLLTDLASATRGPSTARETLTQDLTWASRPPALATLARGARPPLRAVAAMLRAADMAGAMDRALAITLEHARLREQFGKPIGRFQAVQQQLAVMAEQVLDVATAVALAFAEPAPLPRLLPAALAKQRAATATAAVTATAHGLHGAIGLSEEYDLQIFTRRLHVMRPDHGGEDYWSDVIGGAALASDASVVDLLRANFEPAVVD